MAEPKLDAAGNGGPGMRSHKSAAPPTRRSGFSDPELEEMRKGRAVAVLSRMITSSDPAIKINTKGFSKEDVLDAVSYVASIWMKGGHSDKAEILIRTYGLGKGEDAGQVEPRGISPEPKKE